VIEDSRDAREMLRLALELEGHDVSVAMDGPRGVEEARALLVALTGYGDEHSRRLTAEAGFDHHVVKPVDPAELVRQLARGREGLRR
jgi:CheY-like chemotaxis protein